MSKSESFGSVTKEAIKSVQLAKADKPYGIFKDGAYIYFATQEERSEYLNSCRQ